MRQITIKNPSYVVLFDPTIEQVISYAKAMPKVFIFTFLLGKIDAVSDWSSLGTSSYIVPPIYLGNFSNNGAQRAAFQIVEQVLTSKNLGFPIF